MKSRAWIPAYAGMTVWEKRYYRPCLLSRSFQPCIRAQASHCTGTAICHSRTCGDASTVPSTGSTCLHGRPTWTSRHPRSSSPRKRGSSRGIQPRKQHGAWRGNLPRVFRTRGQRRDRRNGSHQHRQPRLMCRAMPLNEVVTIAPGADHVERLHRQPVRSAPPRGDGYSSNLFAAIVNSARGA